MSTRLEREVRFLKIYAIAATAFFTCAFTLAQKNQKFEELDVERINIVEKDGQLRIVISNQERQHPGIMNGKVIARGAPRPPGLIFFNQLGDEMGGLVFGENGGDGHFGSLTWDKVRGDQTMGFRHLESDDGTYQSGLQMWQQPNIAGDLVMAKRREVQAIADASQRASALQALRDRNEIPTDRLFLGKQRDDTVTLSMADKKGRPRIELRVAPDGTPVLEFLDEAGKVTYRVPREQ